MVACGFAIDAWLGWGVAAFCWILILGLLGLLMLWWFRAVDFRLRAAVGW